MPTHSSWWMATKSQIHKFEERKLISRNQLAVYLSLQITNGMKYQFGANILLP